MSSGDGAELVVGDEVARPRSFLPRALLAAVALFAVLVALGGIVQVAVVDRLVGDADLWVTRWISERRTDLFDSLANIGSSITDTITVLGVLVGAVAMLAAADRWRHGLVILVAVAIEFSVFLATSAVIGRPRPAVEPLGEVPSTNSFPSGHAAMAVVLFGTLTLVATSLTRSRLVARSGALLTAVIAVFVGGSRVYEGVHHPIDVAGGIVLGLGALTAVAWSSRLVHREAE